MRQVVALFVMLVIVVRLPLACLGQTGGDMNAAPAGGAAQQVRLIPSGAFVEVVFADKKKARGYLNQVAVDGFSFSTGKGATGMLRQAAFSDVKSVRIVQPSHTPIAAWIATGVVAAVVVVVVAVLLIERHNE